jgi:hypothetical protein
MPFDCDVSRLPELSRRCQQIVAAILLHELRESFLSHRLETETAASAAKGQALSATEELREAVRS